MPTCITGLLDAGLKQHTDDPAMVLTKIRAGEKGDVVLKPSGIAIHPVSGDLYVLSTVPQLLLILSANGRIRSINRLNPGLFEQPEGIAFDDDQNLYISNERVRHQANILKFPPQ